MLIVTACLMEMLILCIVPERTWCIQFICSAYCAEIKYIHKHFMWYVLSENNFIFLVTPMPLDVLY